MLLVLVAADPAPVDGAAVHAAVLLHVVTAAGPRLLAAHALELGDKDRDGKIVKLIHN